MNHDDQHLKNIIRSESSPNLPSSFVEQTVHRLQLPVQKDHHLNHGLLALNDWLFSHKWWLMGFILLLGALVLQHQQQASIDDELIQIDTLSMSSFSVL